MKVITLNARAGGKMSDEMKTLVNDAFEASEEVEDKELENIKNSSILKARTMINEIEELLAEIDSEELTKPNKDYVESLIMHLGEFTPEPGENETEEYAEDIGE